MHKTNYMTISRKICFIFLFSSLAFTVMGQDDVTVGGDPWPDITESFSAGDATTLATYFSSMVDLGLPEKDNSYSKSQGEIVMRDFFKKCPPESFVVIQKGKTSETAHYAICHYKTSAKKYQVSIYLKQEDHAFLITKIKFDNQD